MVKGSLIGENSLAMPNLLHVRDMVGHLPDSAHKVFSLNKDLWFSYVNSRKLAFLIYQIKSYMQTVSNQVG